MEPFAPLTESPAPKKGRALRNPDQGRMIATTLRLPKDLRNKLDLIYRNDPDFRSVSDVIVRAIEEFVPKAMKKIEKTHGKIGEIIGD